MKDTYLKIVLLGLVVVVAIQGYYLYDMNRMLKDEQVSSPFNSFFDSSGDSFVEMEHLRQKMETNFMDFENFFQTTPAFNQLSSRLYRTPHFDMKEQDSKYIITMEVPGLDKSAIDIKTENGRLVVSANVSHEKDNNTTTYYRHERRSSSYKRVIQLPSNADDQSLHTDYKDGLLTITFDKKIP